MKCGLSIDGIEDLCEEKVVRFYCIAGIGYKGKFEMSYKTCKNHELIGDSGDEQFSFKEITEEEFKTLEILEK
jgi:hypothetical protein